MNETTRKNPKRVSVSGKKVLVACEFSGTVRDAFASRGHDAWSCDLLPTESEGQHIEGDVLSALGDGWDLMVAHPPCTYLCCTANRWMLPQWRHKFPERPQQREDAAAFFLALYNAPIPRVAIENPVGVMSTRFRKPNQVLQPWQFGHGETKATCLWLKNLPNLHKTFAERPDLLLPAGPVEREQRLYKLPPSPDRWKLRSTTYQGIADAMAEQWGNLK